jgi:LCP family protein required for cell wall assembly
MFKLFGKNKRYTRPLELDEGPSLKRWLLIGAGFFAAYFLSLFITGLFLVKFMSLEFLFSLMPKDELKGVNILAFGVDDTRSVKRADTIVVFHLDSERKRVGTLSIPRDTRVKVEGYGHTKINHTFAHGGVDLLRQSVSDFLGVPIDYYVKVNLNGVIKVVDALGGVEIDVDKELVYTDQAAGLYIQIEKGKQVLNGEKVMHYLRFRHDSEGDIGRIRRQQKFMTAVAGKVTSPTGLFELPSLIRTLNSIFDTDLSMPQMISMGLQFKDAFVSGAVDKGTVPGAITLINGASYWRPDIAKLDKVVTEALLGFGEDDIIVEDTRVVTVDEEASQDDRRIVTTKEVRRVTEQSEMAPEILQRTGMKVEVLNGLGVKGVAQEASALLKDQGVQVTRFGNAGSFSYDETLIVDWKGNIEKVIVLANLLKIDPDRIIVYDRPSKPLDATLVLGKDWNSIVERLSKEGQQ